jgi:hypothetical protein
VYGLGPKQLLLLLLRLPFWSTGFDPGAVFLSRLFQLFGSGLHGDRVAFLPNRIVGGAWPMMLILAMVFSFLILLS